MLHSLRSRLILLVFLSILPGVLLVWVIANEQRAHALQEVQNTNASFLRLVTSNQSQLIQNTRSLVTTLAAIPDLRNQTPAACNRLLAQILQNTRGYRGFSLNDPQGNLLCSVPSVLQPINVSNTVFFRRAFEQGTFVIGGFERGMQSGKGNLTFALPITNSQGEVTAIIGAGLDVDWLNQSIGQLQLPDDYIVNIIDRAGTVLVRWPSPGESIGSKPVDTRLIQHMLDMRIHNVTHVEELEGLDGVRRIYTFSAIGAVSDPDLFVSVGVSTEAAFSQINQTLTRNLVALTASALIGILMAWLVSNGMIIYPLTLLTHAAQKLQAGDLTARTGITRGKDEIGELAHTFDTMADRLQTQTHQLTAAERQQRILAEAGMIFSSPLDFSQRVEQALKLLVEHVADWGMVNVFESDQTIKQLALIHTDSAKTPLAHELVTNYPTNNDPTAIRDWLLQARKSAFFPQLSQEEVQKTARDARHSELLQAVGVAGIMIVPLIIQGKVLGEITMVRGPATAPFKDEDLTLVEEIARRAAVALDYALLFQTTQTLNQTLEQQVAKRTEQLRESAQQLRTSREQMRELAMRQRDLLEEEQTRISRDVHDNMGQNLTGLKMDLARLQRLIGPAIAAQPNLVKHFATMSTLIDTTIQNARNIARQMRPSALDDLGLAATIEWYCGDLQTRTDLAIEFENCTTAEDRIPKNVATEAYRILQEALTNVIRHAQATHVQISLEATPDLLHLNIRDNGVGIDPQQRFHTKSLGVLGMQERAYKLGGTLEIQSELGRGTVVTVALPCNPTD